MYDFQVALTKDGRLFRSQGWRVGTIAIPWREEKLPRDNHPQKASSLVTVL
ncbi:hypothetical protein [Desulfosporosinus fructosivorans]|uniref:hypothetical protein n=1 Tax=Desulfosporosinus fructosivorans TaxID=2018669 RepID=UPI00130E804E|nr:hypothetical protein [Desulfosporosinus fructosivorans]